MTRRHPVPCLWLLTDERMGADVLSAVAHLPRGAGVVVRHYSLERDDRRALFDSVRAVGRRRGLVVVVAGSRTLARRWRADGRYGVADGRKRDPGFIELATAHNAVEAKRAARTSDAVLLSPVFPTRSHPGARPLGRARFGRIAQDFAVPALALGGVTPRNAGSVPFADGWAGIDAFGSKAPRSRSRKRDPGSRPG